MSRISRSRTALMLGAANAALAAILSTTPACAQSNSDQVVGTQVVADHQRADHVRSLADTSGFRIVVETGSTAGSDLSLRDNEVSAVTRANRSDSELTRDRIDGAGRAQRTDLTSNDGAISASGDALIVTTQRGLASISTATSSDGVLGAGADTLRGSAVGVAANRLDTQALGNDADAALSLTGSGDTGTAGILGFQSNDNRPAVTSTNLARVRLGVGASSGSDLDVTGNLVRASGYGNAFSSSFGVTGTRASGAPADQAASWVPGSAAGDPVVSATFATLSHQEQAGSVSVRAGANQAPDPFRVAVFGPMAGSSLHQDGNALVAGGYGNQSDNAMTLRLNGIAGSGAVATVTALQRAAGANIEADTLGGIRTDLMQGADHSSLSLSDNLARATAIANLADDNQLSIEADAIDTFGLPGAAPVGTASTGDDQSIRATAAFSIQNVQDFGDAKVGAVTTTALRLGVLGPVDGSSLRAEGNIVSTAATGNGATNGLGISGAAVRTSADLNNVQTGDGGIRVLGGDSVAPLGVVLDLPGTVRDSQLTVSNNVLTGSAIGNSASNTMAIAGTALADGSGHGDAVAGPLLDGYGAAADFALASNQKLGLSGSPDDAVGISSSVSGRFGILGDSRAYGSDYVVEGNVVRSTVVGNTVANRLSLTGVSLGSMGAPAPGSALSSAQYGQVYGRANSAQTLVAPGSLSGSGASVKGNTNQAYAGINDADNMLRLDAVDAGELTGRMANAVVGNNPAISGDDVLGSVQFAGGSIAASAITVVANGDPGLGLEASPFSIEDNVTGAEASANRAVNTVQADTRGVSGVSAGLANMQMNTADVGASASIDVGYRPSVSSLPLVDAASLTIAGNTASALARGNAADNALTVSGALPTGAEATIHSRRYEVAAEAEAPLLNAQSNYGAVSASVSGAQFGASLNAPVAGMTDASAEVRGNTVSAAAYGNTAVNAINASSIGNMPSAAIVSAQVNYGPVTAVATDNQFATPLSNMTGSSFALTGNQISAIAVGNQAANAITGLR